MQSLQIALRYVIRTNQQTSEWLRLTFVVSNLLQIWIYMNARHSWPSRVYTTQLLKVSGAGYARKLGMTLRHTFCVARRVTTSVFQSRGTGRFHSYSDGLITHPLLRDLFYWVFPPLIQAKLDEFKTYWNNHRIRKQKNKAMPSGHVPMNAFCNPAEFLGVQCKIPVPPDAVQEMRAFIIEETGQRENWISDDFAKIADDIYLQISSPALTLDNAWEVFTAMSNAIHTLN